MPSPRSSSAPHTPARWPAPAPASCCSAQGPWIPRAPAPDDKQGVSGDCGWKRWCLTAPTLLEADTRPKEPPGERRTECLLLTGARPDECVPRASHSASKGCCASSAGTPPVMPAPGRLAERAFRGDLRPQLTLCNELSRCLGQLIWELCQSIGSNVSPRRLLYVLLLAHIQHLLNTNLHSLRGENAWRDARLWKH